MQWLLLSSIICLCTDIAGDIWCDGHRWSWHETTTNYPQDMPTSHGRTKFWSRIRLALLLLHFGNPNYLSLVTPQAQGPNGEKANHIERRWCPTLYYYIFIYIECGSVRVGRSLCSGMAWILQFKRDIKSIVLALDNSLWISFTCCWSFLRLFALNSLLDGFFSLFWFVRLCIF